MHNPLCAGFALFLAGKTAVSRSQFADKVLSGAMNFENRTTLKAFRLAPGRRLEWFAVSAEPRLDNPVSADTSIDAARNRLYFR
jgi:hypothetical protein